MARPALLDPGALYQRLRQVVPAQATLLLASQASEADASVARVILVAERADVLADVADGWMGVDDAEGLFLQLGADWRVRGARCDARPDTSWTVLWTLGPRPLHVWTRKGLRLESDGAAVWGSFAPEPIPRDQIAVVRAMPGWLGLRCAVLLRTRADDVLEIHAVPEPGDDEERIAWAVALAERIREVLDI